MVPATPRRQSAEDLLVGDTVDVPGGMYGTVRFVGTVQGKKGTFAGVELHQDFAVRGKNSGDVDGRGHICSGSEGVSSRFFYQLVPNDPNCKRQWASQRNKLYAARPAQVQRLRRTWRQSTQPRAQTTTENISSKARFPGAPNSNDSWTSSLDRYAGSQATCKVWQPDEQQSIYPKRPWHSGRPKQETISN
ncbi:Tip elongation protein 1 [Metarhizium anisopliae]